MLRAKVMMVGIVLVGSVMGFTNGLVRTNVKVVVVQNQIVIM